MSPLQEQVHQIVTRLVVARHRAGLSQSALGAKVGLAQSHISKIERSAVDPQVSSLVEIARALDLELMLIPTQLVPAVQALRREAVPDPRRTASAIDHDLTRLARRARGVMTRFPDLLVLADVAAAADELRGARLDESSAAEARSAIDAATAVLDGLRSHPPDRPALEQIAAGANAAQALAPVARTIRNLRDAWLQRDTNSFQAPAYRLDDADA